LKPVVVVRLPGVYFNAMLQHQGSCCPLGWRSWVVHVSGEERRMRRYERASAAALRGPRVQRLDISYQQNGAAIELKKKVLPGTRLRRYPGLEGEYDWRDRRRNSVRTTHPILVELCVSRVMAVPLVSFDTLARVSDRDHATVAEPVR
jgi:hypothetical protein